MIKLLNFALSKKNAIQPPFSRILNIIIMGIISLLICSYVGRIWQRAESSDVLCHLSR